jgi:hypothetical protein
MPSLGDCRCARAQSVLLRLIPLLCVRWPCGRSAVLATCAVSLEGRGVLVVGLCVSWLLVLERERSDGDESSLAAVCVG